MKYRNTLLLFLLLMPVLAFSHGYWLDITGTGKPGTPVKISIYFGEIDKYGVRQREAFTETPAADVFSVSIVYPDSQQQPLRLSKVIQNSIPTEKVFTLSAWTGMISRQGHSMGPATPPRDTAVTTV
ncbi:hypothetical protein SAMN05428949_5911 [Chitinophaga sp. YR627]|uniref:hypothetical protein n=1 Tax=Chitinophaga sp. YR627 TaxID=1881041 RepID=UPI0008F08068|nr:hypothetical protein [Chitinophaga sp. YR627]SFO59196.1 hypothetical protein SAMN05428949_5911 [Chitinophaga sp. YR627]